MSQPIASNLTMEVPCSSQNNGIQLLRQNPVDHSLDFIRVQQICTVLQQIHDIRNEHYSKQTLCKINIPANNKTELQISYCNTYGMICY